MATSRTNTRSNRSNVPQAEVMYKWSKAWVVQVDADDPTKVGDIITVSSFNNGDSQQEVLAVVPMSTRRGGQYNTLVVQEYTEPKTTTAVVHKAKAPRRVAARS